MRVSCHLITWGDAVETGLREASELGFHACETLTEFALTYIDRPAELRRLLECYGLTMSALYAGGRLSDPRRREEVVDANVQIARLLAALGVDRMVIGPAGPRSDEATDAGLREAAETLNAIGRASRELGVLACLHPHMWTEIQTERELAAVMEQTDPDVVFLCPDTAHLAAAGMDPAAIIRRYADRIRYMHIKDLRSDHGAPRDLDMSSGRTPLPIFCELGRGVLDFDGIMDAVRGAGYDGWLTVEIDQTSATPRESLAICRDFLTRRLGLSL